jgi:hypothetical protein
MTQTPSPRFATRPPIPGVGTPEYVRWSKEFALPFAGGTLSSAYGNMVQTFNLAGYTNYCAATSINVSRTSSSVVNTIGGSAITRAGTTYVKKQYKKKNAGLAAAGETVVIRTDVGEFEARLTGSMQSLVEFVCANSGLLYGPIEVFSPSGASYGPFNPVNI